MSECLYVCVCICNDMCLYLNHVFSVFKSTCLYLCMLCIHVYVCVYVF